MDILKKPPGGPAEWDVLFITHDTVNFSIWWVGAAGKGIWPRAGTDLHVSGGEEGCLIQESKGLVPQVRAGRAASLALGGLDQPHPGVEQADKVHGNGHRGR